MELVAEMLFEYFQSDQPSSFSVTRLRPAMRRYFGRLPFLGPTASCSNADRFLNRFFEYPRWLVDRTSEFDMFHIVDHTYSHLVEYLPPSRTVVTCHDLDTFRCLLEPERENRPRWFRVMTERILKGFLLAARVICPSEATRSQILRYGLFPPNRVSVINNGVDPVFLFPSEASTRAEVDQLLGPNRKQCYLLHVGSCIPRKRIDVLLKVFAAVRKECQDVVLVRVGGPFSSEQKKVADTLALDGNVVVMPFLQRKTLAEVYRRAALLVQPSDAEGFGLPLIEAMACGCQVVATDLPVLREVGGVWASYCPVADIHAWTSTVVSLLQERQEDGDAWNLRRQRAIAHALNFSWMEAARKTGGVYREVLKSKEN